MATSQTQPNPAWQLSRELLLVVVDTYLRDWFKEDIALVESSEEWVNRDRLQYHHAAIELCKVCYSFAVLIRRRSMEFAVSVTCLRQETSG